MLRGGEFVSFFSIHAPKLRSSMFDGKSCTIFIHFLGHISFSPCLCLGVFCVELFHFQMIPENVVLECLTRNHKLDLSWKPLF